MQYNKLTSEEEDVIDKKGTEKPFTGEYDDMFELGAYICRRCNAPLYRSESKFKSGCGWPSFDDEIKDAVRRNPDPDGSRTEITCANCGAHLGHVFKNEGYTPKEVRHCVNSISMRFIPFDFKDDEEHVAVLGGGCFWCLEASYKKLKGIKSVVSGYAGGHKEDPTYEIVSAGSTGHAEVVRITFDPSIISFKDILEVFFTIHDPTTPNRQGNDVGEQYRSIISYNTWKQKEDAEELIQEFRTHFQDSIVTEVVPLIKFYPAEDYHQDYYAKNPEKAYCQVVINPKLEKLREKYKFLLNE